MISDPSSVSGRRQIASDSSRSLPPLRRARAEIDLGAIAHNVRALRAAVSPAEIIAVVKADAYGHGAVPVARTVLAAGATRLAVALVEEGEELRAGGIDAPVLLLSEPPEHGVGRALDAGLTPSVYTPGFVNALRREAARRGRVIAVHLCVDTGMGRVGVPASGWEGLIQALGTGPELELEAAWTHYACADEPGHPSLALQTARFAEFLALAGARGLDPPFVHAANSAAALTLPDTRGDAVRVGISLYGYAPSAALAGIIDLRPALRFVAEVTLTKHVVTGTPVSYGHTWVAPTDGCLATVPVGYADGVPRSLSNRAHALVRGRRCPVAGNVTMDQLLVWCGDQPVEVGDEVVLLGRQGDEAVTADDWAGLTGTISYEILCGIGPRVPRVHHEPGARGA